MLMGFGALPLDHGGVVSPSVRIRHSGIGEKGGEFIVTVGGRVATVVAVV
ncbi:hypothetical protein [Streptomyces sp. NPDC014727]